MAETVGELCREYVSANAASQDGRGEKEAVENLIQGFTLWLQDSGWGGADADYGVDVRELVLQELRKHRGRG